MMGGFVDEPCRINVTIRQKGWNQREMSIISAGELCSFFYAKLYLTKINRKKYMLDFRNIGCPSSYIALFALKNAIIAPKQPLILKVI